MNELKHLQKLVKNNQDDPHLTHKIYAAIKQLHSNTTTPPAIRKTLNITPANAHAVSKKLASVSNDVEQLQLVTASTLSASQLYTVFNNLTNNGWTMINTDAADQNLTFFKRETE